MRGGEDENLLQGGHAFPGAAQADGSKRFHSIADGDFADFSGAGAGDDELANLVVDASWPR